MIVPESQLHSDLDAATGAVEGEAAEVTDETSGSADEPIDGEDAAEEIEAEDSVEAEDATETEDAVETEERRLLQRTSLHARLDDVG